VSISVYNHHIFCLICMCLLEKDNNQYKKFRGDRGQTCTVIYSTYDAPRLTGIVGSIRAAQMLTSDRPVHLFVSSEDGN